MNSLLNSFSNNILLSNLIKIRWIAIIGQLAAILLVYFYFKIQIPFMFCLLIVIISTIVNILSYHVIASKFIDKICWLMPSFKLVSKFMLKAC